ncbi:MAG: tRNA (adenosine(37)-N6)-dimethylallyltransferase MiaA [Patescibacteria group bacterium UBA2163]
MEKRKVVCVVGPTASGKTSLSITLAKEYNGEVISADSRQVYRGLDIGSGKVTEKEMDGVPHHLLDVVSPQQVFTASEFVQKGREAIEDIFAREKVPIIAGGTGFYIDALLGYTSIADAPPNETLRTKLETYTTEQLQEVLRHKDPERFETIDQKNPRRLIRAIEIVEALGKNPPPQKDAIYETLWIGISHPQQTLHERIHTRLMERLEKEDMLQEAINLHASGLSYDRMEELGLEYRYMARHLVGTLSYDEMVQELEQATKQYAKRQMTWLKRNEEIIWINPSETKKAKALIEDFLAK